MNTQPLLRDQPQQPGQPARRRRSLLRATLAAAALTGAGLLLATPGIASASVSQTSPQWAELGPLASASDQASQVTAVYTIQNVAESGTEMLEDNGNSMAVDTTIDVWSRWYQGSYQDPMATGSDPEITQANYLWEYVPGNPANGGSIVDGYGELINRQSGLCLDDSGSPNEQGDGATITQYTCNGGANQQWTAVKIPSTSSYEVEPEVDNGGGTLGVGNGSTCSTQGDGDSVYIRTTGIAGNTCDEWDVQQASYDFATNPVSVTQYVQNDGSSYGCLTGDTLRRNQNSPRYTDWDVANLSDPEVVPEVTSETPVPTNVPSGGVYYLGNPPEPYTGQLMFYCDPPTTTP
jgi:ricin-type beta-trefoil lectin protein